MGWITSDSGLPSEPALINADTLGGIAADEYATISNIPTDLSELNQDSTHRLVTDSEKNTWNNKADVVYVDEKIAEASGGVRKIRGTVFLGKTGGLVPSHNCPPQNEFGHYDVEFELNQYGDLCLKNDLTMLVGNPGATELVEWLRIYLPESGPHTFATRSFSGRSCCLMVSSATGSYNTVTERAVYPDPSSADGTFQLTDYDNLTGYKFTMLSGYWGRLTDV